MKDKLKIKEANGEIVNADIITYFSITETGKEYIIFTLNEIDSNGLIKLYVSRVKTENDEYELEKIENEKEWSDVKEVMKDVIAGGEA